MLDFQHAVAVLQGAGAMGDDEGRPVLHQALHRFDNGFLGPDIDRAGRLVQNENRRVFQERSRQRNALAFAAREAHATLTH